MTSNKIAFLIVAGFFSAVIFFVYILPAFWRISVDPCANGHDLKLAGTSEACRKKCIRCGYTVSNSHDFGVWRDGKRDCKICGFEEMETVCYICGTLMQNDVNRHAYGGSHVTRKCPECNGFFVKTVAKSNFFISRQMSGMTI